MTQIHAPDRMGKAAHHAALIVAGMPMDLLAASSPNCTREQRAEALVRVFKAWPKICRAMADLQAAAPFANQIGLDEDAKLLDFIERRLAEAAE